MKKARTVLLQVPGKLMLCLFAWTFALGLGPRGAMTGDGKVPQIALSG